MPINAPTAPASGGTAPASGGASPTTLRGAIIIIQNVYNEPPAYEEYALYERPTTDQELTEPTASAKIPDKTAIEGYKREYL